MIQLHDILFFIFFGTFWDCLVTLTQQIVAGKANRNLLCPFSFWMILVYGSIPLFLLPIIRFLNHSIPSLAINLVLRLVLFYGVEYTIGAIFQVFGIEAWNYRWWISKQWSPANGYICWHPAIVLEWLAFVYILGKFA